MTGYDAGYIYKCKMGKLNEDGAIDESEVGFILTASDWPRLLIGQAFSLVDFQPIDSFELMDEEPISSWIETDQRIYAGYKNGKVRAFHLEDDSYSEEILREGLENHHTIEMHDCQSGDVISLATSVDGRFLVSCGKDGNIFSYEVTLPKVGFSHENIAF